MHPVNSIGFAAMIASLFGRRRRAQAIEPLYGAIMARALDYDLYRHHGVPDTFEGRFEAVTLVAGLVLRRLAQLPPPAADAAQDLVDRTFDGVDSAMREVGISDVGVPKRMKKFTSAFYGRLAAYGAALAPDAPAGALKAALEKNLLEGAPAGAALVAAVAGFSVALAALPLDRIVAGHLPAFVTVREG